MPLTALILSELRAFAGSVRRWRATFDTVAHHVIEYAAALFVALPEPGCVGAGMFLGCAREIRSSGIGRRAPPDDFLAAQDWRTEDLIFQIAMIEFGVFRQS